MTRKQVAVRAKEEILAAKRNKTFLPPELVNWDARHGRRLFLWDDKKAAHKYRLNQAQQLIWSLSILADNARVRAFHNLTAANNKGQRGYVELRRIIETGRLPVVIEELRMRHRNLLLQYKFLGRPIDEILVYADSVLQKISESPERIAAD